MSLTACYTCKRPYTLLELARLPPAGKALMLDGKSYLLFGRCYCGVRLEVGRMLVKDEPHEVVEDDDADAAE